MRIDKYLKLTRIIKRRTVSKDIIDHGYVEVNHKVVKPSFELKAGDIILIRFSKTIVEVEVLIIDEKTLKKSPDLTYRMIKQEANEN